MATAGGNDECMTLSEFLQESRVSPVCDTDDNNENEDGTPNIEKTAESIRKLILLLDFSALEAKLMGYKLSLRKRIVDFRIDGTSAFFAACAVNDVGIAKFLLEKCNADIEKKGTDSPFGWQPKLALCSPICCAARHSILTLPLVKLLVEHGARNTGTDETGMSALQVSCQTGSLDAAMYLHKHGYSVHDVTSTGKTCLILSVKNAALCRFLISKGNDVNQPDKYKSTAIHYAAMDGQLETVKVLIESGANISLKDNHGQNAIMRAAAAVQIGIVEYMLTNADTSASTKSLAYMLLGSSLADRGRELDAIYWWEKANPGQCEIAKNEYVKNLIANGRKLSVSIARSTQPIEELEVLERIQSYSVEVKVRIFGLCHPQTYKSLCKLLTINFFMMSITHALSLLKYTSDVLTQSENVFSKVAPYIASRLLKVFTRVWLGTNVEQVQPKVKHIIIEETLRTIASLIDNVALNEFHRMHIHTSNSSRAAFSIQTQEHDYVMEWICLTLDLICIFRLLNPSEVENVRMLSMLSKLLASEPRGMKNETLLHIAINPNPNLRPYLSSDMVFLGYTCDVTQCLVKAGANVNAIDSQGNTPLLSLLLNGYSIEQNTTDIVTLLLDHGSDIDVRNINGQTCLQLLSNSDMAISHVKYQRLQCLSAIAVKKARIDYSSYLPLRLHRFVDMH